MNALQQKVTLNNLLGLHIRVATEVVKILENKKCEVYFSYNNKIVKANSVLNLLMLSARKGAVIEITATGEEAKEVMQFLTDAFESRFGESV